MKITFKQYLAFRLVLLGLLLISLGIPVLTILALVAYRPDDFIFSIIVVAILVVFILFEIIMTIINVKKPLSIYRIGFTKRGLFNPIPLIAVVLGAIIGLALSLLGSILFFVKSEPVIKCNSLVILSIGLYLLVNCIFYIIFVLFVRKHNS